MSTAAVSRRSENSRTSAAEFVWKWEMRAGGGAQKLDLTQIIWHVTFLHQLWS